MKFSELWTKTCGDNRINWWFVDNHDDKGTIPPLLKNPDEIPGRIWNSFIVRIGAEGNKLIDVGLSEAKPVYNA